jgi:hypothetical protein
MPSASLLTGWSLSYYVGRPLVRSQGHATTGAAGSRRRSTLGVVDLPGQARLHPAGVASVLARHRPIERRRRPFQRRQHLLQLAQRRVDDCHAAPGNRTERLA